MNSERDANRIVRSWLEAGSNGIPDRVLDAVLSELPSTPQRRPRWSPWRSTTMSAFIKIGAIAAVVLLAVVVGTRFLPGDAIVGVPVETSSPAPSATLSPVTGQFTFDADREITVVMDALADGSTLGTAVAGDTITGLSGSAGITYVSEGDVGDGENTVGLQCARQFDDQTWFLAGAVEESSGGGGPVGQWLAVTVRDTSPQQVNLYGQAEGTWDDCAQFVRNIPDSAVEGQEMIGPVKEGGITLPPSAADPISGLVTFPLGDQSATVDVAASAIGSRLAGTATVAIASDRFTIGLECFRMFDDTTWILGGEIVQSTSEGQAVGTRVAVIVRDGSPQQVILWFEDPSSPAGAGCAALVNAIPDEEVVNGGFVPVEHGEISLPASL